MIDRLLLGGLANQVPEIWAELRFAGLTSLFVSEDWISENCTRVEIEEHTRYVVELAREKLSLDDPSVILFDDSYEPSSSYLASLKRRRFADFGPVDHISQSGQFANMQIDRATMLLDQERRKYPGVFSDEFQRRRGLELEMIRGKPIPAPDQRRNVRPSEIQSATSYMTEEVAAALRPYGQWLAAEEDDKYGRVIVFRMPLESRRFLKIVVSAHGLGSSGADGGTVGVHAFIDYGGISSAGAAIAVESVPLHIGALLPEGSSGLGQYRGREEHALVVQYWHNILRSLMPRYIGHVRELPQTG